MHPPLLAVDELVGIYAKLERAYETIRNLNTEVQAFLKESPHASIGGYDDDAFKEITDFFSKRGIPPRFGVIAGEIIHHLRSSLDHIAWGLSSERYRVWHETAISFPIFVTKPRKKDEVASYGRKVQGISSDVALAHIESVQPYNRSEPTDDLLFILHELDTTDKHHNVVLVIHSYNMRINVSILPAQRYEHPTFPANIYLDQQFKMDAKLTPQVAFKQFGKRENQPIIPSLTQLDICESVGNFDSSHYPVISARSPCRLLKWKSAGTRSSQVRESKA